MVSAKRASAAGPRGAQVGRQCGAKAKARTVVVELRFPRMAPSASLSEGVVDVARFAGGYHVWAVGTRAAPSAVPLQSRLENRRPIHASNDRHSN